MQHEGAKPRMETTLDRTATTARSNPPRRVLHVGSGPKSAHRLHPLFRGAQAWNEIRLDIDPAVKPDLVCSTVDMTAAVPTASVDAVWTSHTIEHLFDHEVPVALKEMVRVLAPEGFLLLRCPDLAAVAAAILADGAESVSYISPAGPISPLDMLFGHRPAVARGNHHMQHRTGFTDERLGRLLLAAGFAQVHTRRTTTFDLWAVAFKDATVAHDVLSDLTACGLDFRR